MGIRSSSISSASLPSYPSGASVNGNPRQQTTALSHGVNANVDLGLGIYSSDGLDFPEGIRISDMDKDVATRVRRAKQQYKRLLKAHIRNMRTEKLHANLAKANFQALTDIAGAGGFSPLSPGNQVESTDAEQSHNLKPGRDSVAESASARGLYLPYAKSAHCDPRLSHPLIHALSNW